MRRKLDFEIDSYLKDRIRNRMKPWKDASLAVTGGKCIVSGKQADVVHHNYSFVYLFRKALLDLGLDHKTDYDDFTCDEIEKLAATCLELHFKYGLGAPITAELHKIFHYEYGHRILP